MQSVAVYASDDLKGWSKVNTAVLVSLARGPENVVKNIVPFSGKYKYLYLEWPLGKDGVELGDVYAEGFETIEKTEIRWNRLTAAAADNGYEFAGNGFFPVDRLKLALPQENIVVKAVVFSRPDKKAEWQERYQGVFYRLKKDLQELTHEPITLPRTEDRWWRVVIQDGPEAVGDGPLALELGYIPDEIVFMARGRGPYTLAYGNSRVGPNRNTIEDFFARWEGQEKTELIRRAVLEAEKTLAGPAALKSPLLPLDWKGWLIWAAFAAVLAVLALMVKSLIHEMNQESSGKQA
jgi:hypothetical protein